MLPQSSITQDEWNVESSQRFPDFILEDVFARNLVERQLGTLPATMLDSAVKRKGH